MRTAFIVGALVTVVSVCSSLKAVNRDHAKTDVFVDGFAGAHMGSTKLETCEIRDGQGNVLKKIKFKTPWALYKNNTLVYEMREQLRPYMIYNEQNELLWEEKLSGYADPEVHNAGSRLTDAPFTRVTIENGALCMYDNTDIDEDRGRSVAIETVNPIATRDYAGFVLTFRLRMAKGVRGTGRAFAYVGISDGKNNLSFARGHDLWGDGYDYNASLSVNNKIVYDTANDDIVQPDGVTCVDIKIVNMPERFEYWVNNEQVYADKNAFVDFDERNMKLRLTGHRWNWKGPLDARFESIRCEFK